METSSAGAGTCSVRYRRPRGRWVSRSPGKSCRHRRAQRALSRFFAWVSHEGCTSRPARPNASSWSRSRTFASLIRHLARANSGSRSWLVRCRHAEHNPKPRCGRAFVPHTRQPSGHSRDHWPSGKRLFGNGALSPITGRIQCWIFRHSLGVSWRTTLGCVGPWGSSPDPGCLLALARLLRLPTALAGPGSTAPPWVSRSGSFHRLWFPRRPWPVVSQWPSVAWVPLEAGGVEAHGAWSAVAAGPWFGSWLGRFLCHGGCVRFWDGGSVASWRKVLETNSTILSTAIYWPPDFAMTYGIAACLLENKRRLTSEIRKPYSAGVNGKAKTGCGRRWARHSKSIARILRKIRSKESLDCAIAERRDRERRERGSPSGEPSPCELLSLEEIDP